MKKIILWGLGNEGKMFIRYMDTTRFELIALTDNNAELWGKLLPEFGNIEVIPPMEIRNKEYDYVCIATMYIDSIIQQCREMEISRWVSGRLNFQDYDSNCFLFTPMVLSKILQNYVNNCTNRILQENYWRNIYIDTISGYEWYSVKSLSLGRWAVGYQYAYVLGRILNVLKPQSILECGLGQSSKIINSFANYFDQTSVDIVEQDERWIEFWREENKSPENVMIHWRKLLVENMNGGICYRYDDFESVVRGKKYTVLSIDGPFGGDYISRVDIVEYLPSILNESFAILVDDTDRVGERATIQKILCVLKENGIDAIQGTYSGEKDMTVIVPESLKFLLTL